MLWLGRAPRDMGEGSVNGLSGGGRIPRRRVDAIEKLRRRRYTDWRTVVALKVCK